MSKTINFTKKTLLDLPIPKGKRETYKDIKERGLSIYITNNGIRTFFIRKRVEGKDEKIIIGNFPDLSVDNARNKALEIKSFVAKGINPNDTKRQSRAEYTLGQLFEEYMTRYSKPNKKSWKYDEREILKFLGEWFRRKISKIKNQEIRKLHEMTKANNGLYQANRLLERIKSMYNKAIEWEYIKENPANGIKKYKETKRERFLLPLEIKTFFEALEQEKNIIARNYFKILFFTGARKSNVLAMRWEEIDFERRIWRIPETKNGDPQDVPLIDYALEILNSIPKTNEWVFPSDTSKVGHFADPKRPWQRIRILATLSLSKTNPALKEIIEELQSEFSKVIPLTTLFKLIEKEIAKKGLSLPKGVMDLRIHDIRRTLASYQAITGTSLTIIAKTLGQKSLEATQIYARLNNDPVRQSMNTAIDKIMEYKI